ncbi:toll/interleukin-1 receptor domain-containing protein [Candidatus Roizmanbacteria bacterium]|nr:toll/interleukin-1 receptor domain-containing protein [Candidatus Roizmanbacteria bacterium]
MANHEHLEILKQGAYVWNKWRLENIRIKPNLRSAKLDDIGLRSAYLSAANFSSASLTNAYMRSADLSKANLRGANLYHADLRTADLSAANICFSNANFADLSFADLSGADISGADLSYATLIGADLKRTNIIWTNFSSAILTGAEFHGGTAYHTIWGDVDLSEVKGLESVVHNGPSLIGIDTFFKSKGQIPEAFLRGSGVPDQMIEYAKALTASPIDFYSCFISYSSKDDEFAKRIYADLQAEGVRCWFAPHDMKGGRKVHHQIDEAIRTYDKLLLILSVDSMSSNWVGTEIIRAKKKEDREEKQVLFPIGIVPFNQVTSWELFDSDSGRDLAREIREYHIPDFSNCKTDSEAYQAAFNLLLRDLKTS